MTAPRDAWVSITDVYGFVSSRLQLLPDDYDDAAKGNSQPRWQRNVRNILQYRRSTGEVLWDHDGKYQIPSPERTTLIRAERELRHILWDQLIESGAPERVEPGLLRELGVYRGQAGIFADRHRTNRLTAGQEGVAIGLLHTGRVYPDDIGNDGVVYHYPLTDRPGVSDANEIEAVKWAFRLNLPVFVISSSVAGENFRQVRLAFVEQWLDDSRVFHVAYHGEKGVVAETTDGEFLLEEDTNFDTRVVRARPGQARFKFEVLKRYGAKCAVCDLAVLEMLEAAHILPKGKRGTDDPRNGLILCASHHRAFDADLFAFQPDTHRVQFRKRGPSAEKLRITASTLLHLPERPHRDALEWRWKRFQGTRSGERTT